jgi:hypothetical protein
MKVRYRVHRASDHTVEVDAKIVETNEVVRHPVPSLEVELVPVAGGHGSIKLQFVGKEWIAAAREQFKFQAEVIADFVPATSNE